MKNYCLPECPVCLETFSKKNPPYLCGDCDHNLCLKDINILYKERD